MSQSIVMDGRVYTVLSGDPALAQAEPGKHSLAVIRVQNGEAEIFQAEWIQFRENHGEWWHYPDGVTLAPVAALREALAIVPSNQLVLPGLGTV